MAKKGLGRGLGALIPAVSAPEGESAEDGLIEISLSEIKPNPNQPRKHFDQASIDELVRSIQEYGVVQPVVVRPVDGYYELVAGERRWRAAKEAGFASVQALVREVTDMDALQIGLIENLQREDLNAIEEAEAYRRLITDYEITQSDLANHLGKSRSAIANTLRLLSLPDEIKQAIVDGQITSGHARALLALADEESQRAIAERIKEERLSVREVEQIATSGSRSKTVARPQNEIPAALVDMAKELTTHLDLPVNVGVAGKKGYVKLTFASADEFSKIVELLRAAQSSLVTEPAEA